MSEKTHPPVRPKATAAALIVGSFKTPADYLAFFVLYHIHKSSVVLINTDDISEYRQGSPTLEAEGYESMYFFNIGVDDKYERARQAKHTFFINTLGYALPSTENGTPASLSRKREISMFLLGPSQQHHVVEATGYDKMTFPLAGAVLDAIYAVTHQTWTTPDNSPPFMKILLGDFFDARAKLKLHQVILMLASLPAYPSRDAVTLHDEFKELELSIPSFTSYFLK